MIGAIIGDVVGSRFEWHNIKAKEFDFFHPKYFPTDDSIMTLAIAKALHVCGRDYSHLSEQAVHCMQEIGRPYPNCGYGGHFFHWIYADDPQAIMAFLGAESFEDAIRNAISIGGDSDTIAAITGGIAEAYFGVPDHLAAQLLLYLDRRMLRILREVGCELPRR